MSKILVTGGLGFIGSHLVPKLVELGHKVHIVDDASSCKVYKVKGAALTTCDIRDFTTNAKYDYVIHLAAVASITNDFNQRLLSVNVHGFEHLFRNLKYGKFIYASSAAVKDPRTPYGQTKRHNEITAGKDSLGFRFENVYGRRDNGVIGKVYSAIQKKKPITIYGGEQTRDFVHVDDVTDYMIAKMDWKGVLEVGTGVNTSIFSLLDKMRMIHGLPAYNVAPRREWETRHSFATQAISHKYTLETGLREI